MLGGSALLLSCFPPTQRKLSSPKTTPERTEKQIQILGDNNKPHSVQLPWPQPILPSPQLSDVAFYLLVTDEDIAAQRG